MTDLFLDPFFEIRAMPPGHTRPILLHRSNIVSKSQKPEWEKFTLSLSDIKVFPRARYEISTLLTLARVSTHPSMLQSMTSIATAVTTLSENLELLSESGRLVPIAML